MNPRAITAPIVRWFVRNGRDLPWRRATDAYPIWVSEIMLQQTRIETVIPYYRRFLRRFPSVRRLAQARLPAVLKAWEGLGYYARARNLHRAAGIVVEQHEGRFPETADEWVTLPGIGAYTAAALGSIVGGEPVPVVDGNVVRVVCRLLNAKRITKKRMELYLEEAIDPAAAGDFNQGMMELGQVICTPRSPRCPECPLRRGCRARRAGTADRIPERRPAKEVPHHEIAVGVCRKAGRILVSRRRENGFLGGLWEFPGGKIRAGESAERALRREFREEVGIDIEVGRRFAVVPFRYSHFSVRLHTFHCRHVRGRARAIDCAEVRWARRGELEGLAFPRANRTILEALE